MAGCPPIDPYRQPSADELANSLLRRLIPTVDAARAVGVRLGLRQYEVRIIRTQWTGEFRGEGEEFLVDERPLTPTPLVMGLDSVNRVFESVGAIEEGNVMVSEISGRYTEDYLTGYGQNGEPPGPNEQVFYEIRYPSVDGDGVRRRFTLRGTPSYFADKFEWRLRLEKAIEDRSADRYA